MPCFLLPVSAAAVAVTWASASAATFSVIIRVVSASAHAPLGRYANIEETRLLAPPSTSLPPAAIARTTRSTATKDQTSRAVATNLMKRMRSASLQFQGVRAPLNCFRTAAAELPTRSIARANSSLVTPRCRVQYLTCSSCSIAILLRSGVTVLLIIFAGLVINGVASGLFRLTGIQRWAAAGRRKRGCGAPVTRPSTVEPATRFSQIKSCMRVSNSAQKYIEAKINISPTRLYEFITVQGNAWL